jgi:hypothetical protein
MQMELLRFGEFKITVHKYIKFKKLNILVYFSLNNKVVDCEIAVHPLPDKSRQLEDKRVIKVEGKVLAPLTSG